MAKATTKKTTKKADPKKATTKTAKTTGTKKAASTKTTKKTVAKSSTKKTAVKKSSTAKKSETKKTTRSKTTTSVRKQTAKEKKLVVELTNLLPQLDEEGLQFLIEQTHVHLYNMEVMALHEAQEKLMQSGSKGTPKKAKAIDGGFKIVSSGDGYVYHIVSDGKYTMFNDTEMFAIIKIAHAGDDLLEARKNLFHWFFRERRDFINDLGLGDIQDTRWDTLLKHIRKNFKLKK